MSKRLSVTVLAAALLMSGALVGVAFGGSGGITKPEVIELDLWACGDQGPCDLFELVDTGAPSTGNVLLSKNPLYDLDGNKIGNVNLSCLFAEASRASGSTDWVCTYVHTLRESPTTARGTVVATGIYTFDDVMRFAVTGGTGAYVNARGHTTINVPEDTLTLSLIP